MGTVLITGANRGIGLALVEEYVGNGYSVIACCRDPASATALVALADAHDGRIDVVPLDVGSTESIRSLGTAVGDRPIDIILNNAGINGTPKPQSADEIDPENWIYTMRVNALGPLLVVQALRDNLFAGDEKKVVAITSVYGSIGKDFGKGYSGAENRYAYRSSKAALNNGMRRLAEDWEKHGVIVGIIDPGFVQTDMTGEMALNSEYSIAGNQSAIGIAARIAALTPEDSGQFTRFSGEPVPW